MFGIQLTVGKRAKRMLDTTVETTTSQEIMFSAIYLSGFQISFDSGLPPC